MTVVGLLAIVAALAGQNVLAILLGAGVATLSREWIKERYLSVNTLIVPIAVKSLIASGSASAPVNPVSLRSLFVVFLKFGAVVFGSGYVLLAFLQADLVGRLLLNQTSCWTRWQ